MNHPCSKSKKLWLLLLVVTALPLLPVANAFARSADGTNSGGGGVGYSCAYRDGSHRVYLADTYSMITSGQISKLLKYQPIDLVQATAGLLDVMQPEKKYESPLRSGEKVTLGFIINYRHQQLKFNPNFDGHLKLPTLNDDHIESKLIPSGCQKVQLAVQDIPAMKVEQSPLVYQLSWPERGFMELHETLISLRGLPGEDTTPIRQEVSKIANELESSNSSLRQQIANVAPQGLTDFCFTQRTKIDVLLSQIVDPGIWGNDQSIKKMCESSFAVGDELFLVALFQTGAGFGPSHEAEMKFCADQIGADVEAKLNTIYAYKRRCTKVVEKNRCNGTDWGRKFELSAQLMGLGAYGLCPVYRIR